MISESTPTDDEAHTHDAPGGVLNYIKNKLENRHREVLMADFVSEIEDIRATLKGLIDELKFTKENCDELDDKEVQRRCAHISAKIATVDRHLTKTCEIFQMFFGHHPYDKEIQAKIDDGF